VLFVLLAVCALLIGAQAVSGLLRVPPGCARAVRDDLVVGVKVTGTLRAVESTVVGPPQVSGLWRFKIAMMADEGAEVAAGQPVLAFDPSELDQRLRSRLADLDAARTEVEKKRVDLAVTIANDRLALAEVEARLRRATLIADQPSRLRASTEIQKARLDQELAELEVNLVRRRIAATRTAGQEELAVLEATLAQVTSAVQQLRDAIDRMQRPAPRDGIVIHVANWRNEKKKVGDTCWVAEPVLEIPDLSRMQADGEVVEAEAGRIREGQPVTIQLDAHPDREYPAVVESISRSVHEKSWRNPLKIVRLTLTLAETDPEKMRPGMRFRGLIEVDRRTDVTLIPMTAIGRRGDTPIAIRRGLAGWSAVPLKLGARGSSRVEVIDGLAPGDLISLDGRR
jgi:multidrug efflux pump subunit AcrA (membrane-fusion protein)